MKAKPTIKATIFLVSCITLLLTFKNVAYSVVTADESSTQGQVDVTGQEQEDKTPAFAPGRIIFKLKDADSDEGRRALFDQSYSKVDAECASNISRLMERHEKLQGAKYLFGKLHKKLRTQNISLREHQAQTEAKFSQRQGNRLRSDDGPNLLNIYIGVVEEGNELAACEELSKDPDIEYAEPEYIMETQMIPDDPYYHSRGTWGQNYDDLWGLKKVVYERAWDISQGGGVVVAVIDTGVDYNHEDLTSNIWVNPAEVNDVNFDGVVDVCDIDMNGDGSISEDELNAVRDQEDNGFNGNEPNGYVDDIIGYDFSDDDPQPIDDVVGHGTHVAGTIAAVGNNGKGVIGVVPRAKIMPVKVFPNATSNVCASAIVYAADNGARVLNNSWGPRGRLLSNHTLETAIDYAYSQGCVVVFSAGNSSDNVAYYSPANYSKTIAVASTGYYGSTIGSFFTNWGGLIDVSAPGEDILSLRAEGTGRENFVVGEKYYRGSGTSMAAPHVSGVAAMVMTENPDWPVSRTIEQVVGTAMNFTGYAGDIGVGRVNAYRVLTATPKNIIGYVDYRINDYSGNGNGRLESGEAADIIIRLKNFSGTAGGVQITLTAPDPYVVITNGEVGLGDISGWRVLDTEDTPFSIQISAECPVTHEIPFKLTISANEGEIYIEKDIAMTANLFLQDWPVETGGRVTAKNSVVLADVDGDGADEVIVASDKVYVFNGKGELLPGWPRELTPATKSKEGNTPAVGDIDGDGDMEIVVSEFCNYHADPKSVLAWHSDGTPVAHFPVTFTSYGTALGQIGLADLDADGQDEIVLLYQRGAAGVNVLKYTPSGVSQSVRTFSNASIYMPYQYPAIGDVDNDGPLEFFVNILEFSDPRKANLYIFRYAGGDLSHDLFASMDAPTGGRSWSTALGDVDKDGDLEVFTDVYGVDSRVYAFRNDGTPLDGWPRQGFYPVLGDIDGDGYPEIVCRANASTLLAYRHNSDFMWGRGTGFSAYTGPSLGDIDGDGIADVIDIVHSFEGHNYKIFAFNGSGGSIRGFPVVVAEETRDAFWGPGMVALGDINGDSLVDLVTGSLLPGDGRVYSVLTDGAYDRSTLDWPMYGHDSRHTGRYAYQNRAPVLDFIGDKIISEDRLLEFTLSSSDPDSGSLNYRAENLPEGAELNDNGDKTAAFAWTPTHGQIGEYPVTFVVSDGELEDSETITIAVREEVIEIELTPATWSLEGVRLGDDIYNTDDGTRYGSPMHLLRNTGDVDVDIVMTYAGWSGVAPSYNTLVDRFQTSVALETGHLITIQPEDSPYPAAVIRRGFASGAESPLLVHYTAPTELTEPVPEMTAQYDLRAYAAVE